MPRSLRLSIGGGHPPAFEDHLTTQWELRCSKMQRKRSGSFTKWWRRSWLPNNRRRRRGNQRRINVWNTRSADWGWLAVNPNVKSKAADSSYHSSIHHQPSNLLEKFVRGYGRVLFTHILIVHVVVVNQG